MKKEKPQTLTKSEMQVMNILWDMPVGACVRQVVERYPDPKPAYTTVSTFLKILQCKGFVETRKGTGKQLIFSASVTRQEYTRRVMSDVKDNFFDGSASSLIRFFVHEEQLRPEDIRELLELIEKE